MECLYRSLSVGRSVLMILSTSRARWGRRVAVGMSGGVDSAVSALLLQRQGYDVLGVFMHNWDESDEQGESVCSQTRDWRDVQKVCDSLKMECIRVDFVKEYWNEVFEPSLEQFRVGRTPNPDILCNRMIKFSQLYRYVFEELNVDYLATGHYARLDIGYDSSRKTLFRGFDRGKDQSYFLACVPGSQFQNVIFPVGHMLKSQVRKIARDDHLIVSEKKDSTGICFVGERRFPLFLGQYLDANPGEFIDIESGRIVGEHRGIPFYTIGQRSCIPGVSHPYFVAKKELESNRIYVCVGTNHPSLFSSTFQTETSIHWLMDHPHPILKCSVDGTSLECNVQTRYRQQPKRCRVRTLSDGSLHVQLDEPERAVTPGQVAVFYLDGEVLGGVEIKKT